MITPESLAAKLRELPPELLPSVAAYIEALRLQHQPKRSVLDLLAEAPVQRGFANAGEVQAYLQAERDSWAERQRTPR